MKKILNKNNIKIAEVANENILVLDVAGTGNNHLKYSLIKEAQEKGEKVLILDFYGSYKKEEIIRTNLFSEQEINYIELSNLEPILWKCNHDVMAHMSDILIKVLDIKSYIQKKWIKAAVESFFKKYKIFCMPQFIFHVECMYKNAIAENSSSNEVKHIERLLSRMEPYERLFSLGMSWSSNVDEASQEHTVTIIQLNHIASIQKRFVARFLLGLLWAELKLDNNKRCYNLQVLDEFQGLSFCEKDPLLHMLKDGGEII